MVKKITACALVLIMALTMCVPAFAASDVSYTESFFQRLEATKVLNGTVTSFTYGSGAVTNNITFDFYDDLTANTIACNFKNNGINIIYKDDTATCVLPFLFYFSVSAKEFPLAASVFAAVNSLQDMLEEIIENINLDAFTFKAQKVTKNGQTLTREDFTVPVVGAYGSFFYTADGELCEIQLTDNQGEYIAFTLENVDSDYDESVFEVPAGRINLSFIWKLIYIIFLSGKIA